MKLLRFILFALAWVAAALCATWAFGALYFDFPKAGPFAALLFVIALLAIVIFVRGKLLKPAIVFGSAIFCVQTAALMAQIHKGEKPLARVAMIGDFPIGIAKDGTSVVTQPALISLAK